VIASETLAQKTSGFNAHKIWVVLFAVALFGIAAWVSVRGFDYYRLPVSDRAFHPAHAEFRPAGSTGIRLGLFATLLFVAIYLYPLRKKLKILRFLGSTKNILDFHIVMGLAAPFIVALHSAFKFHGLAGMAFWIMLAVVLSGIIGRYLYAQIPRSRKDTEFSLAELEQMRTELSAQLEDQNLAGLPEWETFMTPMARESVRQMSLAGALFHMLTLDIRRPFQVAALRRGNLSVGERFLTLGGFFASSHPDLEQTIGLARKQSWLSAKIFFLDRAAQIFQLWHVIHRPFSYAFLVLVMLHIGMVMAMGFV
jgi:hypothetical protein